MTDTGKLELLFAHDEGGDPFLSEATDPTSAAGEVGKVSNLEHLHDRSDNANKLDKQRWAVVIADGPEGERLRSLVDGLVAKRAKDQDAEVMTVRVPPNMDHQAAMNWEKDVFPGLYKNSELQRPRYFLILGDVDQVSMATQQTLSLDGFPGRLVCGNDDGYQAYVDKVLRWEAKPSPHDKPRSLFYTVHDRTAATRSGYDKLVRPCFDECQKDLMNREFPATRLEDLGNKEEPDPSEFLDLMASDEPTVLFSLSHGMGPPRRRPWTPAEARERQGSMVFGSEGAITPSDVANSKFLPGGLWFYFACFGAGTPSQSAYHHWMNMLAESGMEGLGNLQALLHGLDGQGGFTSGLAQAALANPNGPLGLLGHVDLAWSYSYEELQVGKDRALKGTNRALFYRNLLTRLVKGERLGVSMLDWQINLSQVGKEINDRYDTCKQRGVAPEGADEIEKVALGNLWMRRQDLLGYVLLGDPAVRLPLAPQQETGRMGMRGRSETGGRRAAPGGGRRSRHDGSGRRDKGAQYEQAILEFLLGQKELYDLGQDLGVSESEAEACAHAYRDAGRAALAQRLKK